MAQIIGSLSGLRIDLKVLILYNPSKCDGITFCVTIDHRIQINNVTY